MSKKMIIICILFTIILMETPRQAYVCTSENINYLRTYGTIQEAINRAEPGETVYISSSIYFEHIVINKSINLVGENWTNTIIDGNGVGTIVEVISDNASLRGFTLRNAEKMVTLTSVKNCEIMENIIANITNSTHGTGIKAENCENIKIYGNHFENLDCYHIYFSKTNKSRIEGNAFIANKRWSQPIFLYCSENNTVESNNVSGHGEVNEGGIGLLYSNNNLIRYNYISENDWVGLSLRYSNSCVIKGNTIINHTWYGLKMTSCKDNNVHWNNFLSNNCHIYMRNCENITWSLENLGNYWDNYTGKDFDMNGTGDEPYQIYNENLDFFPLMGKFYRYTIANVDNVEEEIFIISNSTAVESPAFLKEDEQASIVFNVSGKQETVGFCLIKFSKGLIGTPYSVQVNGYTPIVLLDYSDNLFAVLYFTYLHQKQYENIIIIPEFSSVLMFAIFCTLMLLSIFLKIAPSKM